MKKVVLAWVLSLVGWGAKAQDKIKVEASDYVNNGVEMADAFRSNGKIYVLVSVVLIIFAGVIFLMIRTDRKVSALEKEINS